MRWLALLPLCSGCGLVLGLDDYRSGGEGGAGVTVTQAVNTAAQATTGEGGQGASVSQGGAASSQGGGVASTGSGGLLPNGSVCSSATECNSGFCTHGYCCDQDCLGSCQACNYTVAGTCTNFPAFTPCGGGYLCDGGAQCPSSCSIASDCEIGYFCVGQACTPQLTQGDPCTLNVQCATLFCRDGYCCNSTCSGLCQSCNGSVTVGQISGLCDAIVLGADPDQECSNEKVCDGMGACTL